MKKYLIISDLDGTLLDSNGQLTQNTIDTVNEITNQGHIFCIATGRPKRGSIDIYNELKLNSIMLNQNGAYISNPTDPHFSPIDFCFSKEIAKNILKIKEVRDIISNAFLETRTYELQLTKIDNPDYAEDLLKYYHLDVNNDKHLKSLNNDPDNLDVDVSALLLYIKSDDISQFDTIVYFVKTVSPNLQLRMVNLPNCGFVVEINTMFTDKVMGLNYLASYYGIPTDRILTFGDGDNDMRMLQNAKYGFAMKNGRDTAKLTARHITKHTNNEDGVAWELKYFFKHLENLN